MTPTTSTPSVSYRHDDDRGEHQIGIEHDGHFVAFAVVDDQSFKDAVAREASPEKSGDSAGSEGGGE